jgi:hypothetical protein
VFPSASRPDKTLTLLGQRGDGDHKPQLILKSDWSVMIGRWPWNTTRLRAAASGAACAATRWPTPNACSPQP